jgi:hypothetical protein
MCCYSGDEVIVQIITPENHPTIRRRFCSRRMDRVPVTTVLPWAHGRSDLTP